MLALTYLEINRYYFNFSGTASTPLEITLQVFLQVGGIGPGIISLILLANAILRLRRNTKGDLAISRT
jgi:hypothetical protein